MTQRPGRPLSTLFLKLADLALAHGVKGIKHLPACWEVQIDERWWVAVNGHEVPVECSRAGQPVPAFSAYVEFNGWPAGVLDPFGGFLAAGHLANEANLTAAIDAAIHGARAGRPA